MSVIGKKKSWLFEDGSRGGEQGRYVGGMRNGCMREWVVWG